MVRLISWNVNGIRAVHKRGDLDWLWNEDHDVVCIQETKAHVEQLPKELVPPPGWKAIYESGEKKGYSGVATFVREGVQCDLIARGLGEERFDNEGRVLITDMGPFILLNIYFPNGGRGGDRLQLKNDFNERFLEIIEGFVEEGRDVVTCGDFNIAHRDIDIARPEAWSHISGFLPAERAFFDRLLDAGFVDTFRAENGDRPNAFTWWDVRVSAREINEGWRIDYFVINENLEDFLSDAWISSHISGSDHCPVGLELELELGLEEASG